MLADLSYTFLSDPCSGGGPGDDPLWLEILSHISLAITTLFLLEIPLALYGFGVNFYNPFGPVSHASLHLFDAIIILATFVLEVVLKGKERELASLLVVLRLWRLVKLVGGSHSVQFDTLWLTKHSNSQALQWVLANLMKICRLASTTHRGSWNKHSHVYSSWKRRIVS